MAQLIRHEHSYSLDSSGKCEHAPVILHVNLFLRPTPPKLDAPISPSSDLSPFYYQGKIHARDEMKMPRELRSSGPGWSPHTHTQASNIISSDLECGVR
jgi:hypothetical protein